MSGQDGQGGQDGQDGQGIKDKKGVKGWKGEKEEGRVGGYLIPTACAVGYDSAMIQKTACVTSYTLYGTDPFNSDLCYDSEGKKGSDPFNSVDSINSFRRSGI